MTKRPVIAVFGLGEAGSLIAADLAATGLEVHGFDPRDVADPPGVKRYADPVPCIQGVNIVIALTAAADALEALNQAFEAIPPTALYADFSTASSDLKQQLAERCASRDLLFCDIAMMAVVPGNGLRTPSLASGTGATQFAEIFGHLGMPVDAISTEAGDAAARKLLRSIMMKGLAAVVIEAMTAASRAGCTDWLWQNMVTEITRADERLLARLVEGTHTHALRRLHEMEASAEQIESLGLSPLMTTSTVASLTKIVEQNNAQNIGDAGLPDWYSFVRHLTLHEQEIDHAPTN